MTLPDERYRAIVQARRLLEDLLNPSSTPRVPPIIRQRASGALRHFPSMYELDRLAKHAPNLLQAEIEPVTRLILKHTETKDEQS